MVPSVNRTQRYIDSRAQFVGGPYGQIHHPRPFDPSPLLVPFVDGVSLDEDNDVPLWDPIVPNSLTPLKRTTRGSMAAVIALEQGVQGVQLFEAMLLGGNVHLGTGDTNDDSAIEFTGELLALGITVPLLGSVSDPFHISKLKWSLKPTTTGGGIIMTTGAEVQAQFPNNVNNTTAIGRAIMAATIGIFDPNWASETIYGLLFEASTLNIIDPAQGVTNEENNWNVRNPAAETDKEERGFAVDDGLIPEIS